MSRTGFSVAAIAAVLATISVEAQVDDYRAIEFPELAEIEIPTPTLRILDNGLRLFLIEDHELPLVRVRALVRTGSDWDPEGQTGLAGLTGAVLRTGGTETMTGDEIDDALEALAASVEAGIGGGSGFVAMSSLVEDVDRVLPIFADVLRRPAFAEEKLELAKVQARTGIARRNDDPGDIAGREFSRLVYGLDSPLSRLVEYGTIAAIGREDLVAWHARFFHPNNVLLGVVGDFDTDEMVARLEAVLGDWPRGPDADLPELAYRTEEQPGVYLVEKTDVEQANIRLGHLGIRIDDPDYFAVEVMNEVFGGGFAGRLFKNVRTEKGLAYSVYGSVGAGYRYPGTTTIGMETKLSSMAEAVEALQAEVEAMRAGPPTADEMSRAKESIENSFVFNYASKGQVLAQQMLYAYHGLPADFLERYRSEIQKVTAEDVVRVARKTLHPDAMTLLVVGRSADFDRPLATFGEVTELDVTIPPPPSEALEVEETEATLAAGRALFERVATRLGAAGSGAIALTGRTVLSMGGQSMTLATSRLLVFPDRIRETVVTPGGEQTVVVDGDAGFVEMAGQSAPLPPDRIAAQREDRARDLWFLVRSGDEETLETIAAGTDEVDGTPAELLVVRLEGVESTLAVDAEGRVLRQTYEGEHPLTGVPGHLEVRYDDYREVDGALVPFAKRLVVDGEVLATSTVESCEVDPAVEEVAFERPAA